MDKDSRNAIERFAQKARGILEEDFLLQLEASFDITPSRALPVSPGAHLDAAGKSDFSRIIASIIHKESSGMPSAEAVSDYVRDSAFTTLNRFVALKMLEKRDLILQTVSRGTDSSGYSEFCMLSEGMKILPNGQGYRLYLECVFDELSSEIKVLFDRRDPASVLWPSHTAFEQLLGLLNDPALESVWGQEETIGWVYQFFNSGDERKKMRKESQAPRNSRELAVRNQFFTPDYVVRFLTDNTLGRIWFEMMQGRTALASGCEYMVSRPQDTYSPRKKKDPRDIRVLDPACGSGHFLLYAFGMLQTIYEETWEDSSAAASSDQQNTAAGHPELPSLRQDPGLILRTTSTAWTSTRCAQIPSSPSGCAPRNIRTTASQVGKARPQALEHRDRRAHAGERTSGGVRRYSGEPPEVRFRSIAQSMNLARTSGTAGSRNASGEKNYQIGVFEAGDDAIRNSLVEFLGGRR